MLSLLIVPRPAAAGESGQRVEAVVVALRTGEAVRILRFDGTSSRGRVVGVSDDVVHIATRDGAQAIPLRDIKEITRLGAASHRGAALGAGIGIAVALVVVNRTCAHGSEHDDCMRAGTVVLTPIGAAGGGLVGWLVDRSRRRTAAASAGRPAPRLVLAPTISRARRHLMVMVTF